MIERAIDRGAIPAGSDVDVIMELLYGAAYHRLLQGHLAATTRRVRQSSGDQEAASRRRQYW